VFVDDTGDPLNPLVYRSIAWLIETKQPPEEHPGSFPAISAFVTAWGRYRMNTFKAAAGTLNVYYQGVDSLHVNRQGYENLLAQGLVRERELGYLRLIEEFATADYRGVFDYRLGDKWIRAGLPGGAREVGPDEYEYDAFPGVMTAIAGGPKPYVSMKATRVYRGGTTPRAVYSKAGWRSPFVLPSADLPGSDVRDQ
jgi:hypothetical protein